MATGGKGDIDESLTSGHDVVFDWTCGQCEDDGKTREATSYCQDCNEGFCDPCLKIHRRFPAMKNHRVLDNSQTDQWGKGAVPRGSGHPCHDHDDQTISMYCGDHDVVCCPVCVALDHKGCDDMAYIPKISKGVVKSQEFLKTRAEMSKTITKAKKTMNEAKQGSEVLDSSRREAVESVQEAKQDVIEHFDKLEDGAIEEINKLHENLKTESEEMVSTCSDVCQALEKIDQQTKSDSSVSDSEAFVLMKMGQKKLSECQSVGQKLSDAMSDEIFKIMFKANPGLQVTKEMVAIGHVERGKKESLYSFYGEYESDVDMSAEENHTVVGGMHRLPNGSVLLSDQGNGKLKMIDSEYKLKDSCQLTGSPSQISGTDQADPTEVAVALLNGSLQFASVTNQIKLTQRIDLNHKCNGLLFCGGKVFISSSNECIYIYKFADKKLTLQKTVSNDKDGNHLFSISQDITLKSLNRKNGVIFAADENAIVSLDLDGNHLQTIKHPVLKRCGKVAADYHGNIFAFTFGGRLIQLRGNGKTVREVVSEGVKQFNLDTSNSMLYVWCLVAYGGSHQLKIFKRK